jgi:hypothetical protein
MNRTTTVFRLARRLSLLFLLLCGFVVSQEMAHAQVSACEQCGINEVSCLSTADSELIYCDTLVDIHFEDCQNAALDREFSCYLDCWIDYGWDRGFEEVCDADCDYAYAMEQTICDNNQTNGYEYCRTDQALRHIDCEADFNNCREYYQCD